MNGDWRVYRPAIWLAMLGIALLLIVSSLPFIGATVLGVAIGVALKIATRRRRRDV
jgi:hypothetical protein